MEGMFKIIILIDTIKFRLLWATDQYVHKAIRIMEFPFPCNNLASNNVP